MIFQKYWQYWMLIFYCTWLKLLFIIVDLEEKNILLVSFWQFGTLILNFRLTNILHKISDGNYRNAFKT